MENWRFTNGKHPREAVLQANYRSTSIGNLCSNPQIRHLPTLGAIAQLNHTAQVHPASSCHRAGHRWHLVLSGEFAKPVTAQKRKPAAETAAGMMGAD
jgi:hypothetical protein